jgi:hypothetical protein
MERKSGLNGVTTLKLTDGTVIEIPGLRSVPGPTMDDFHSLANSLFKLAENFDKRLAALEQTALNLTNQVGLVPKSILLGPTNPAPGWITKLKP